MPEKTPLHLWIVGVLSLLWNAMGAYDYIMTQTRNEAYMAKFTPEQLEYFYGFPTWVEFFWALAIWSSVLGSVLLLLRRGWALPVFGISFVSMLITTVQNYALSGGMGVMGTTGLIFSAVIFVVALLLVIYSRSMTARGVLR